MSYFRPAGVLAAGLLVSSCAASVQQAYEGPVRSDEVTAVLSAAPRSSSRIAANVRLDSIEFAPGEIMEITSRSVRILPDENCVTATARTSTLDSMTAELCFDAYPRQEYEVRAIVAGSRYPPQLDGYVEGADATIMNAQNGPFFVQHLIVVDEATGEVVAYHSR